MARFSELIKQRPKKVLNKEMAKAYKPSRKLNLSYVRQQRSERQISSTSLRWNQTAHTASLSVT